MAVVIAFYCNLFYHVHILAQLNLVWNTNVLIPGGSKPMQAGTTWLSFRQQQPTQINHVRGRVGHFILLHRWVN